MVRHRSFIQSFFQISGADQKKTGLWERDKHIVDVSTTSSLKACTPSYLMKWQLSLHAHQYRKSACVFHHPGVVVCELIHFKTKLGKELTGHFSPTLARELPLDQS